jgi:hypothetical protein
MEKILLKSTVLTRGGEEYMDKLGNLAIILQGVWFLLVAGLGIIISLKNGVLF